MKFKLDNFNHQSKPFKLVPEDDRVLVTQCNLFDFSDPPFDPIEFSKELIKFMYDKNGVGLAANQLGIPYKIFAMRGSPENFVVFNPKIVQPGEEQVVLEEGCLSFPGLLVKIKRPQHIRVRFQTPNGDTITKTFTGMTARVFQHEFDHLEGFKFFERANRYHRDFAFKNRKK